MSRPDFTPHPYPIDPEWAASLVGLRLIVPNSWWPDYHDDGLNLGCIVAIDYDAMGTGFFQLQLDGKDYTYGMNYDSVLLYADSKQPGYAGYRLPDHCPANPDIEMVQVPRIRRSSPITLSPPGLPCREGIEENVANGAGTDDDDYTDDDSDDYDEFGNNKAATTKRASTTTK